jgi:hypothetical protein
MKDQVLQHVKLKNGEDLLSFVAYKGNQVELHAPISVQIDPTLGLFAKSWLLLTDGNSILIPMDFVIFASKASSKAIDYYEEFMHRIHEKTQIKQMEEDSEFTSELEELFAALVESKTATKN